MIQARPASGLTFVHDGSRTDLPLVLGLPAMGTPARYYEPFARALCAASGTTVAFADWRGQGESPWRARDGADFGYRELVEEDLPALVEQLVARHRGRSVVLLGHSLGGQLAVLGAHQIADRVAGLALVASGTAHFRAWPQGRRLVARLAVTGIGLAASVLPWYPGHLLGFGGEQPRRLMRDWALNANTGQYIIEGSTRTHQWATQCLRVPVLSLSVRRDPFAPPGAVEELLAKLESASITRISLHGARADSPRRRHFSWARRPDEAAAHVARWLGELPARAPVAPRLERVRAPFFHHHHPEGATHVLA